MPRRRKGNDKILFEGSDKIAALRTIALSRDSQRRTQDCRTLRAHVAKDLEVAHASNQAFPINPSNLNPATNILQLAETKFPSLHPRLSHLNFQDRLKYNVQSELAKPDRQRVLDALHCQVLYLTKLAKHYEQWIRHSRRHEKERAKPILRAVNTELCDAAITLHAVAIRTLCKAMMDDLPREVRDMIYDFALPNYCFNLTNELWTPRLGRLNTSLRVTEGVLGHLPLNRKLPPLKQSEKAPRVLDSVFMGEEAHAELITKFFKTRRFKIDDILDNVFFFAQGETFLINSLSLFPSKDPWKYGIDPRRMLNHVHITFDELDVDGSSRDKAMLKDLISFLGPCLEHIRQNTHWVQTITCFVFSSKQHRLLDKLFKKLIRKLGKFPISFPESVTLNFECPNHISEEEEEGTTYEGKLDAWLDIYEKTAKRRHIKSVGNRFKKYKKFQKKNGEAVADFYCFENVIDHDLAF